MKITIDDLVNAIKSHKILDIYIITKYENETVDYSVSFLGVQSSSVSIIDSKIIINHSLYSISFPLEDIEYSYGLYSVVHHNSILNISFLKNK